MDRRPALARSLAGLSSRQVLALMGTSANFHTLGPSLRLLLQRVARRRRRSPARKRVRRRSRARVAVHPAHSQGGRRRRQESREEDPVRVVHQGLFRRQPSRSRAQWRRLPREVASLASPERTGSELTKMASAPGAVARNAPRCRVVPVVGTLVVARNAPRTGSVGGGVARTAFGVWFHNTETVATTAARGRKNG